MFIFIERMINKALFLDPKTVRRLKVLNNKRVLVTLKDLNMTLPFELFFNTEGLQISTVHSRKFDVTVLGPSMAYLCLAITKDVHKAGKLGLVFEGNLDTAKAVQDLFINLDIDWEELVSKMTGDTIAHKMGSFFKDFKKINKEMLKNFKENVVDYIQEEKQLLPSLLEVEYFYKDIEILRDDVERVAARIEILEQLLSKIARKRQDLVKKTEKRVRLKKEKTSDKKKNIGKKRENLGEEKRKSKKKTKREK